jgi:hypothetical protein
VLFAYSEIVIQVLKDTVIVDVVARSLSLDCGAIRYQCVNTRVGYNCDGAYDHTGRRTERECASWTVSSREWREYHRLRMPVTVNRGGVWRKTRHMRHRYNGIIIIQYSPDRSPAILFPLFEVKYNNNYYYYV